MSWYKIKYNFRRGLDHLGFFGDVRLNTNQLSLPLANCPLVLQRSLDVKQSCCFLWEWPLRPVNIGKRSREQPVWVQISRSALLTAHIIEGASTFLYPLSSNPPYGLPSANQIKKAGTVFLKEITSAQSQPRVHSQPRNKGKHRDWLVLLLREHLGTVPPTLTKIFPLRILSSGFEICDEHSNTRSSLRRLHT